MVFLWIYKFFFHRIEHVLSKDLDELAHKIFSILSPQFIIITTPNYEFNVCFGPTEAKRFRHYDHKFEWTRKEFQDWLVCSFQICILQVNSVTY